MTVAAQNGTLPRQSGCVLQGPGPLRGCPDAEDSRRGIRQRQSRLIEHVKRVQIEAQRHSLRDRHSLVQTGGHVGDPRPRDGLASPRVQTIIEVNQLVGSVLQRDQDIVIVVEIGVRDNARRRYRVDGQ